MINYYDPKHYTLICELFNDCNLHCKFCVKNTETPDLEINAEYITKTLPDDLRREVLPDLIKRNVSTLLFNIYGGELLMDKLPDSFFDNYRILRKTIDDMIHEVLPECKIYCTIVTNAVFSKKERVLELLNDIKADLNISYDPSGRYLSEFQFNLAKSNIEYFKNNHKLNLITVTVTKPTIQLMMEQPEKYVDWLPKDITLDLSYYLPMNNDNEALMPSDEELYRFFKWCLDYKLFNVSEINNFLTEYINPGLEIHSYCHNAKITSKVNGKTVFNNCCADMVKNFYLKGEKEYYGETNYKLLTEAKGEKRLVGKRLRNCIYCEWADHCPGMCYVAIMWHGAKLGLCPIARIFEYIKNNPKVIEDYKNFDTSNLKR